jgi:glyoxylase-like metal-dependent hydrolase (beta-lactamase superfamily II)
VHDAIPHWWSNLQVTAYTVPGHTEGSAVYLTNSVLFVGDSLQIKSNQQITGPSVIFSTDRTQGEVSSILASADLSFLPRQQPINGRQGRMQSFAGAFILERDRETRWSSFASWATVTTLSSNGNVAARAILRGLHHEYRWERSAA